MRGAPGDNGVVESAALGYLAHWVTTYGYVGIFSLLMLGIVGLPIPDETLLIFSGYLVLTGRLHLVPTAASALAGSACGITVSYIAGRTIGIAALLRFGRFLHLTEQRLKRSHEWFERLGKWTLLIGYFVPGVRHLTALMAGASRLEYPRFALFAYLGAFVWSSTFLTIGYYVGAEWERSSEQVRFYALVGGGFLTLAFVIVAVLRRKD